MIPVEEF